MDRNDNVEEAAYVEGQTRPGRRRLCQHSGMAEKVQGAEKVLKEEMGMFECSGYN